MMETKKNYSIILTLFSMLALFSCGDRGANEEQNELAPIMFSSSILNAPKAKAVDDRWSAGDRIGVYMFEAGTQTSLSAAANKSYSVDANGTLTPVSAGDAIYYPAESTRKVDFAAYYPYQANVINFLYKINLSNQSHLEKIDFLYADNAEAKNKNKESGLVVLKFVHKLSKIEFNITPGDGISNADLAGLKIRITNMITLADLNLATGTIGNQANMQPIEANMAADGLQGGVIVMPGMENGRVIEFILSNSNERFTWTIPDTKKFKSGEKTKYNVIITRNAVLMTATITPWVAGNGSGETVIVD